MRRVIARLTRTKTTVSKVLIALMCGMLMLSGAACQNKEQDDTMSSGTGAGEVKTASDACSHCAGTQTATASGTCPVCGMKPTKS